MVLLGQYELRRSSGCSVLLGSGVAKARWSLGQIYQGNEIMYTLKYRQQGQTQAGQLVLCGTDNTHLPIKSKDAFAMCKGFICPYASCSFSIHSSFPLYAMKLFIQTHTYICTHIFQSRVSIHLLVPLNLHCQLL